MEKMNFGQIQEPESIDDSTAMQELNKESIEQLVIYVIPSCISANREQQYIDVARGELLKGKIPSMRHTWCKQDDKLILQLLR